MAMQKEADSATSEISVLCKEMQDLQMINAYYDVVLGQKNSDI